MTVVKAFPPATLRWTNHYSSERAMMGVSAESVAIPGAHYSINEEGVSYGDYGWSKPTRIVLNYPIWMTDDGPQHRRQQYEMPHSVLDLMNTAEEHEAMLLAAKGLWKPVNESAGANVGEEVAS